MKLYLSLLALAGKLVFLIVFLMDREGSGHRTAYPAAWTCPKLGD
jgi:hypothetical protein